MEGGDCTFIPSRLLASKAEGVTKGAWSFVVYPTRAHFLEAPSNNVWVSVTSKLDIANTLTISLPGRQFADHLGSKKKHRLEIRRRLMGNEVSSNQHVLCQLGGGLRYFFPCFYPPVKYARLNRQERLFQDEKPFTFSHLAEAHFSQLWPSHLNGTS